MSILLHVITQSFLEDKLNAYIHTQLDEIDNLQITHKLLLFS